MSDNIEKNNIDTVKNWTAKVECDCGAYVSKTNMRQHKQTRKCVILTKQRMVTINIIPYLDYMLKISNSDNSQCDKDYICDIIKQKIQKMLL